MGTLYPYQAYPVIIKSLIYYAYFFYFANTHTHVLIA
jgi:hypothetical protein